MSTIADEQQDEPAGQLWREAAAARAGRTIQEDRVSMDDPAIRMIDPGAVVVPPRLRPEDPAHTAALVASVLRDGVRSPIDLRMVGGKLTLIAGLHRLRAAIAAGLHQIPAIVREVDDDEAELLEIEENLIRHDLNALDRAVFVAQWKAVYDRLYPLAGKRGRKLRQVGAIAFPGSAEAKKVGLSRRSIERSVLRVGRIAEDVRPLLAGTDAAMKGVVLDALGGFSHDDQRAIVALHEAGEAKTIALAIRRHRDAQAAPRDAQAEEDLAFARALTAWTKWPAAVQRRLLAHLGATIAPAAAARPARSAPAAPPEPSAPAARHGKSKPKEMAA